jgi:N utilization substance protein A
VEEDQLSLAIGRHGQNVRLAARLTGWDIDILTPDEYNQGIERLTKCVKNVEGADETLVDKLIALGIISILDLDDVGAEPLVTELNIKPDLAQRIVTAAVEEAKNMAADAKKKQADELMKEQSQPTQIEELQQEQPQPKQAEELMQEQPQPNLPADSTNQT